MRSRHQRNTASSIALTGCPDGQSSSIIQKDSASRSTRFMQRNPRYCRISAECRRPVLPAEIIAGQFVGSDADLLSQISGSIVRDQCAIVSEKPRALKKLQLRCQTQSCYRRFGIDEINVGKAHAPLADKKLNSRYPYSSPRSLNWSTMSRAGASQGNPAGYVPTTFFESAKVASASGRLGRMGVPCGSHTRAETDGRRPPARRVCRKKWIDAHGSGEPVCRPLARGLDAKSCYVHS